MLNYQRVYHGYTTWFRSQAAPATAEHNKVQTTTTCAPFSEHGDSYTRSTEKHRESTKEYVTLMVVNGD